MKRVFIGEVGVDSGQLVLCDPSYIDSEWKNEDFKDIRVYQHKTTGVKLQYGVDFNVYTNPIQSQGGKDMNELLSTGEWKELELPPAEHNFSYNACARATLSEERSGQLNYNAGHPGVAVAFSTAYGDGVYPVYANYDKHGELISVSVHFQ